MVVPKGAVAVVLVCLVQFGFGGYGIILQGTASGKIDPYVFSLLRDALCFPVMLTASLVLEGRSAPRWSELPPLLLLALPFFVSQALNITGIFFTDGTTGSIFQQLIPIVTAVLATGLRMEPFPRCDPRGVAKVMGVLGAGAGAVLVVLSGGYRGAAENESVKRMVGQLMLFTNASLFSGYLLLQKHWVFDHAHIALVEEPACADDAAAAAAALPRGRRVLRAGALARWAQRPVSLSAWTYFFASLLFAAEVFVATAISPTYAPDPANPDAREPRLRLHRSITLPLTYSVLVSSFFAYAALSWANKHLPASLVAALWPIQVVATVVLAFVCFEEVPSLGEALGAGGVVLGVLAVLWAGAPPPAKGDRRHSRSPSPSASAPATADEEGCVLGAAEPLLAKR
mmetsp:Transcript_15263/g.50132  ORF Transcript_15263/g.50132 Transcript_15263/m.50132 type:complete len:400 (-) Transcript_15263:71-1270(-)